MIRRVTLQDAAQIAGIYNHYVVETAVSFETQPLTVEEMRERIRDISGKFPYLVEETEGKITGYCYVHAWKERAAYRFTYETTIYLDRSCCHKGSGKRLMERLIEECRQTECKTLIACITGNNAGSIAFHEKLGFVKVSDFKSVGYKFGQWLDVVDYQLILKP